MNITWTTDIREALTDAAYVVSSGGAARKAGMTREDLLKGNAEIAAQFGISRSYVSRLEKHALARLRRAWNQPHPL